MWGDVGRYGDLGCLWARERYAMSALLLFPTSKASSEKKKKRIARSFTPARAASGAAAHSRRSSEALNMAFTYCCDVAATSAAVEAIVNSSAALCLDLEWDSHDPNTPLSLIQAATGTGTGTGTGQPFLLDVVRVPSAAAVNVSRMSSLGEIIASQHPVAMHAAAQDRLVLQRHGIALTILRYGPMAEYIIQGCI